MKSHLYMFILNIIVIRILHRLSKTFEISLYEDLSIAVADT